jgi:hypothetical protein
LVFRVTPAIEHQPKSQHIMTNYIQLSPKEKFSLLQEHSCGTDWTSLDDKKWCLHCSKQFSGHSARVYEKGGLWLECGTPDCDGSPIDWADYPWWDENHPETKAHNKSDGCNPELN